MHNIAVIGVGPHAKRIYVPILMRERNAGLVNHVVGLDVTTKKEDIEAYRTKSGYEDTFDMFYIDPALATSERLHPEVDRLLSRIVHEYGINGIIISTEPTAHAMYGKWAMSKGISVLVDKPISAHRDVSTSWSQALRLLVDYEELVQCYEQARSLNPHVIFSVMAQRRYHPAFVKLRELVAEVTARTGAPISSIQSFHSDGQWRLPSEIIDIDYHSFNQGYGKCSHSGYHSLDIVPWVLEAGETAGKQYDQVDVFANFVRPADFVAQITYEDYRNIFPQFDRENRYNYSEFLRIVQNYGEIDAFCSFAFKSAGNTLSLGSINLAHNGFSQRGWLNANGKDLYKGNGRVRHENHIIEQGPFQAIHYHSYQSEEILTEETNHTNVGGERHLDMHVFRNSRLFPDWRRYEKITIQNLDPGVLEGYSRGHQEDARRYSTLEFLDCLSRPVDHSTLVSDLLDHKRGCVLMAGVYLSAIRRLADNNPLVTLDFTKHALPMLELPRESESLRLAHHSNGNGNGIANGHGLTLPLSDAR